MASESTRMLDEIPYRIISLTDEKEKSVCVAVGIKTM